jgi:hypothetical protein
MQSTLASKATLVMTNVPGPRKPVHLAGVRLGGVMFWVPQPSGLGLGMSVFSYGGKVMLGVAVDERLGVDPQALVEGFHAELEALWRAATQQDARETGS